MRREGVGGKISFPGILTKAGSRRRAMSSVCRKDKNTKNAGNSASVQNVCARTALTDSSSNKQQLQETVNNTKKLLSYSVLCFAWEMEDKHKINFLFNIFLFSNSV